MKPYLGIWTSKNEMLQIGYRKSLEFYVKCGITAIVVGYEGAHPEYYRGLKKVPPLRREESPPTLREICDMARDLGLEVEVVIDPKCSELASNFPETSVVDVLGNRSQSISCPSNPDVIEYILARIRDIAENYDGIMGLELDGLYIDMHPRMTNPHGQPGAFYPIHHIAPESCFCEHCLRIAREEGIDIERVRKMVKELTELSLKPSPEVFYRLYDSFRGAYDMVRFLLRYPELIEWLDFRCRIVERALKAIWETIKAINPKLLVSDDMLPPTWSWSIGQNYGKHRQYCDYYKIIFFHRRTGSFEVNPLIAIKDKVPSIPEEDIMDLFRRLTGYEGDLSFAWFSQYGFPPINVYYEIRKAKEEVGASYPLVAGIVGDAPATPTDIEDAMMMAAKGGANGFCLHTWYGRTTPSNYAAFGNKGWELIKRYSP
ncbi:MAG: hypothetical protein QW186_09865 [Candidatus Bathyarchaeia archaeon]